MMPSPCLQIMMPRPCLQIMGGKTMAEKCHHDCDYDVQQHFSAMVLLPMICKHGLGIIICKQGLASFQLQSIQTAIECRINAVLCQVSFISDVQML